MPPGGGLVAVLGRTLEAAALRDSLGRRLTEDLADAAHLLDADHPFAPPLADRIGAAEATRLRGASVRIRRAPWKPEDGDDWRVAETPEGAFAALASEWRRVFLALGRDRMAPFQRDADRWYLTRIRGPAPDAPPTPRGAMALGEGPFTEESEAALLRAHRIDAMVARNVGGTGAWPKIAAARRLGVPVVLLAPPSPAPGPVVETPEAALAWLAAQADPPPRR